MNEETIDSLRNAIREIESVEGLTALTGGHGLQSRTFEFQWSSPTLEISFSMPYGRVLSDEETQRKDEADIGAACRLAILLIETDADGMLLDEGETSMLVTCDRDANARYQTSDADGNPVDSGDDWAGLVARLEARLGNDAECLSIIWP